MGKSLLCSYIEKKAPLNGIKLVKGVGLDTESNVDYFPWRSIFMQLFDVKKDEKRVRG